VSLPRVSAELPGTGGRLRVCAEDFEVEEIPAYEPSGEGEHLFLWVEKRDLSADHLVRHVARQLGVNPGEVGCAGLKDTRAVTRQFLSVPARVEEMVPEVDDKRIRVLSAKRHGNKLKTGHLRGNRFVVHIREPAPDALERARAIVAALHARGVPNYFGPQRFGRDNETAEIGMALIRGERHPALGRAKRGRRGFLRRLGLSAAQSLLFNDCLAARIHDDLLGTVLDGDVCLVCQSGGPFVVEDREREQARFDTREIVHAGPMFGPKMRAARGAAAEREESVLRAAGLEREQFAGHGKLLRGTRRANVIWPEIEIEADGDDLVARFTLDKGCYATVVLDEITKAPDGGSAPENQCDP
jgi:tRNA pseudouridine13 synthase